MASEVRVTPALPVTCLRDRLMGHVAAKALKGLSISELGYLILLPNLLSFPSQVGETMTNIRHFTKKAAEIFLFFQKRL